MRMDLNVSTELIADIVISITLFPKIKIEDYDKNWFCGMDMGEKVSFIGE